MFVDLYSSENWKTFLSKYFSITNTQDRKHQSQSHFQPLNQKMIKRFHQKVFLPHLSDLNPPNQIQFFLTCFLSCYLLWQLDLLSLLPALPLIQYQFHHPSPVSLLEKHMCLKAFYQSKSSASITQYIPVWDESKISCVHTEDLSTWCGDNLWFSLICVRSTNTLSLYTFILNFICFWVLTSVYIIYAAYCQKNRAENGTRMYVTLQTNMVSRSSHSLVTADNIECL